MPLCLALLTLFFIGNIFAGQEVPDLVVEKIHNNVYLHRSFSDSEAFGLVSSNGLVVVSAGTAFIIDTPWSQRDTKQLVTWVKEHNYELLGSVSTHSHEDRTAGIEWLNAHAIPTYASDLTNELLRSNNKSAATHSLEATDYSLANGAIEVFYPGAGHAIDNIVIWLKESKILFGGCLVRSLGTESLGYVGDAHIEQWFSSAEKVFLRYPDARIVVPGHGKTGDRQLLQHTMKLTESADKAQPKR